MGEPAMPVKPSTPARRGSRRPQRPRQVERPNRGTFRVAIGRAAGHHPLRPAGRAEGRDHDHRSSRRIRRLRDAELQLTPAGAGTAGPRCGFIDRGVPVLRPPMPRRCLALHAPSGGYRLRAGRPGLHAHVRGRGRRREPCPRCQLRRRDHRPNPARPGSRGNSRRPYPRRLRAPSARAELSRLGQAYADGHEVGVRGVGHAGQPLGRVRIERLPKPAERHQMPAAGPSERAWSRFDRARGLGRCAPDPWISRRE
jgi:hypothetical protein